MQTEIQTPCESRQSKDYWYLDRGARGGSTRLGLRAIALVVTVGVMLAAASCGTVKQGYGLDEATASRESSSLLGGLVGGVLGTVTGTVDGVLKWFIDPDCVPADPNLCPFGVVTDGRLVSINSTQRFDKVEFYYTDGSKENFSLYTYSFSARTRYGKTLDGFMVRLKSDGSKWFFDNGKWFIDADSSHWYSDVDSAAPTSTQY